MQRAAPSAGWVPSPGLPGAGRAGAPTVVRALASPRGTPGRTRGAPRLESVGRVGLAESRRLSSARAGPARAGDGGCGGSPVAAEPEGAAAWVADSLASRRADALFACARGREAAGGAERSLPLRDKAVAVGEALRAWAEGGAEEGGGEAAGGRAPTEQTAWRLASCAETDAMLTHALTRHNDDANQDYAQVVLLGDAFDVRPFAIDWPPGTVIFSVASRQAHDEASRALRSCPEATVPRACLLRRVALDGAEEGAGPPRATEPGTLQPSPPAGPPAAPFASPPLAPLRAPRPRALGHLPVHLRPEHHEPPSALARALHDAGYRPDKISLWVLAPPGRGRRGEGEETGARGGGDAEPFPAASDEPPPPPFARFPTAQLGATVEQVAEAAAFGSIVLGDLGGADALRDVQDALARAGGDANDGRVCAALGAVRDLFSAAGMRGMAGVLNEADREGPAALLDADPAARGRAAAFAGYQTLRSVAEMDRIKLFISAAEEVDEDYEDNFT